MTEPVAPIERRIALPAGDFRLLEWPGEGPTVIFLHGLSASADVWALTMASLGGKCHAFAIDQRGHGSSPAPGTGYTAGDFAQDALALRDTLGDGPVHLVGHSMGARVAMVAAAMRPGVFASVVIVDIGPEAWKQNWVDTVAAFDRLPDSFADREAAIAYNARGRTLSPAAIERFLGRLVEQPDGSYRWRANFDALKQTVRLQRGRGYWREWERISDPLLLIRGETSDELRPSVAAAMRVRNPLARYEEFAETGHNIPLLAPDRLAESLAGHWARAIPAGNEVTQ